MANPKGRVLVTGATGLVGRDLMYHYASQGYPVTAISRRPPFSIPPGATHLPLDLSDAEACTKALSPLKDVVQIVFAALYEEPDLVKGWQSKEHGEKNGAMLRNTLEGVLASESLLSLRNVVILQGPKAYGVHVHPVRPGAREGRDEDRSIPNFYWTQEDYLKQRQLGQKWSYTILRPALVIGLSTNGAMNLVATLGIYAAVLKERGEPLYFPGSGTSMVEATDTGLIAQCAEWALSSENAQNQTFNLTNGEFFSLKEEWSFIAQSLGMKPGPDRPISLRETMPTMAAEWDAIRKKYGLKAPGLQQFLGQSAQFSDFMFARKAGSPSAMSCIHVRRAGFTEYIYTDEMFGKWFEMYQSEGLLPPLQGSEHGKVGLSINFDT